MIDVPMVGPVDSLEANCPRYQQREMFLFRSHFDKARRMSTKHVRTTGDLVRFGAALKIDCTGCGASRTLNGAASVQVFGLAPLSHARARAKCSRCGSKAARFIVLPPL